MEGEEKENPPLPTLRPDLKFYHGPKDFNGAPTYILADPIKGNFEKLNWAQAEIVRRLSQGKQTIEEFVYRINKETTINISQEEVMEFCTVLDKRSLTNRPQVAEIEMLNQMRAAKILHPLTWLLHHYLFFRIPLLNPDVLLEKTMPVVSLLASAPARAFYFICAIIGLLSLSLNFDSYVSTFPYFFNWKGALLFGTSTVVLKAVHEFSHAYVAKACGVRVPQMGIAFMVMWPMPFCDVTDSWRLRSRYRRLLISVAGMLAELAIASVALCVWHFAPPGPIKSLCFILSSVTLIGTLLANLNPAMRFDGYYILGDTLGIDNLQPRAFALTLQYYRELLFGIKEQCPEPRLSMRRRYQLIAYSFYAWIYRFFLYIGIATLVYFAFAKVLGLVLMAAEIVFFIVRPAQKEIGEIWIRRDKINMSFGRYVFWGFVALLIALAIFPFPRTARLPSITRPVLFQPVYAPFAGQIVSNSLKRGESAKDGELLFEIYSRELDSTYSQVRLAIENSIIELEITSLDEKSKGDLRRKEEELSSMRSKLKTTEKQLAKTKVFAGFSGKVLNEDPSFRNGVFVRENEFIGAIGSANKIQAVAYASESQIQRLRKGMDILFSSPTSSKFVSGRIKDMTPLRSEFLQDIALASVNKGEIPVVPDNEGRFEIEGVYYEIIIELDNEASMFRVGQKGEVMISVPPRSLLSDVYLFVKKIIIRESGF